jgi:hypothetical protein
MPFRDHEYTSASILNAHFKNPQFILKILPEARIQHVVEKVQHCAAHSNIGKGDPLTHLFKKDENRLIGIAYHNFFTYNLKQSSFSKSYRA